VSTFLAVAWFGAKVLLCLAVWAIVAICVVAALGKATHRHRRKRAVVPAVRQEQPAPEPWQGQACALTDPDPLPPQAVDHFIDRIERYLKENA
jgi:hypothetical protein